MPADISDVIEWSQVEKKAITPTEKIILASEVKEDFILKKRAGNVTVKKGDFIVKQAGGRPEILSPEAFSALYEFIG